MTVVRQSSPAVDGRRCRHPRRSALAVAIALAGSALATPAFALGCKLDRTGDSVVLSRNPLETPNSISRYGYASPNPTTYLNATGLDRLQADDCQLDGIGHDTLVTDRPIELVINNAGIPSDGARNDISIDLSKRFVTQAPGSTARNRIVINGGGVLSTYGPSGVVPLDVVFNGGRFGGVFSLLSFNPNGGIRDGDTLTLNGGSYQNTMWLGGGADTITINGGDGTLLTIYGDGGTYRQADLNTAGNRFDDTFTITGGRVDELQGDSGDLLTYRDADGRYTQDSTPAGNDRFIFEGGWVRDIRGNDGDDRLELRGNGSLYRFLGGRGSDTVEVAAGASLANVYSLVGGWPALGTGYVDPSTDVDTVRFRGQTFTADSRQDGGCPSGQSGCTRHLEVIGFNRVELLDGSRLTLYDSGTPNAGGEASFGNQADIANMLIDGSSTLVARKSKNPYQSYPMLLMSLANNGTVDLGQDATGDVLWVYGDWSGNGRVLMTTVFGGDGSATDGLRIEGNASGRTVLDITQAAGSTGAQTVDGILVVDTRGTSTADAFVLAAPITTSNGLWQYRLEKASTGANAGKFVLTSAVPAPSPPPPTTPPPTTPPPTTPPPTTPPPATPPPTTPPPVDDGNRRLLAPTVTTAAMSAMAAQALVTDGIADVDARSQAARGTGASPTNGSRLWMRAGGDRLRTHGDRFGQDLRRLGLRVGIDLQQDAGVTRGVMLGVSQADGEVEDGLRPTVAGFAQPLSADVGDMRLRAVTLGGYQTLQWDNGLMLDVTAEAGALRARLQPDGGLVQRRNGWSAALSATVGKAFDMQGWSLQPQAQLVAARARLDAIEGPVSSDRLAQDALRARLGVRASTADTAATQFYGAFNLWRELYEADDVVFRGGSDATSVRPGLARSWAELAVGLRHAQGKATWFGHVGTQRGIGGGDRRAIAAQAGVRLDW